MSVSRTHCTDCGFEVAPRTECPLCGHHLSGGRDPKTALRSLFGG